MIEIGSLRRSLRLEVVLNDFQFFSRRRRADFRAWSAGVNQGLDLVEWTVLVLIGACLFRMAVRVEL